MEINLMDILFFVGTGLIVMYLSILLHEVIGHLCVAKLFGFRAELGKISLMKGSVYVWIPVKKSFFQKIGLSLHYLSGPLVNLILAWQAVTFIFVFLYFDILNKYTIGFVLIVFFVNIFGFIESFHCGDGRVLRKFIKKEFLNGVVK